MKRLPREFLTPVLKSTGGRYFGVHFKKKDGTLREINAHPQPDQGFVPDKDGYLALWDRNANGWRKAHIDKIKEFSFNGTRYKVV